MEQVDRHFQAAEGMDVIGADGGKVGKVIAVRPSHVVVEKGFFFPTDYYIPRSAIARQDEHVHLNVTKADALNRGWGEDPGDPAPRTASDVDAAGGPTAGGTNIPAHGGDWLGGDSGDAATDADRPAVAVPRRPANG